MIDPKPNETRLEYLGRVLYALMDSTIAGEQTIGYDGVECDGLCLAQDFLSALNMDEDDL